MHTQHFHRRVRKKLIMRKTILSFLSSLFLVISCNLISSCDNENEWQYNDLVTFVFVNGTPQIKDKLSAAYEINNNRFTKEIVGNYWERKSTRLINEDGSLNEDGVQEDIQYNLWFKSSEKLSLFETLETTYDMHYNPSNGVIISSTDRYIQLISLDVKGDYGMLTTIECAHRGANKDYYYCTYLKKPSFITKK